MLIFGWHRFKQFQELFFVALNHCSLRNVLQQNATYFALTEKKKWRYGSILWWHKLILSSFRNYADKFSPLHIPIPVNLMYLRKSKKKKLYQANYLLKSHLTQRILVPSTCKNNLTINYAHISAWTLERLN